MTFREIVYMINDELKIHSDDSNFTIDHIMFLCSKYRAMLIHQRYTDIRKSIAESNYSTICLDLEQTSIFEDDICFKNLYLRSTKKIPFVLKGTNPKIYPIDYFLGEHISYINRDRMKFVGHIKYLNNIIYCTIGPDNYLYLKSKNPQFKYLQKVKVTAIFEDINKLYDLQCSEDKQCDILDMIFPIEENLVPQLIQLVVQELKNSEYSPADIVNNANDDMSNIRVSRNESN